MKKITTLLFCCLLAAGCTDQVPTGHVGKVRTVSGFSGNPLAPGLHNCYGRDRMYLIEVTDKQYDIPMSVLCQDQLNFKFNIGVLAAVDKTKTELLSQAFENVTPTQGQTISMDQLFEMYIKPIVDQEARKVVSRYQTSEIANKRNEVIEGIRAATNKAVGSSLMLVKRITVNNLDFPDIITQAQEARAQRQIEVETMKAETDRQMEKARGLLKVAQLQYERELIEAAMIADSNKIIGASISPQFLAWHELKVLGEAAKGPNNWGFIPYTSQSQNVLATDPAKLGQMTVDNELLERIRRARNSAAKGKMDAAEAPQTPPQAAEAPAGPK